MSDGLTPAVTEVEVLRDYVLLLTFADGRRGTYDFAGRLWGPAFAPLRESYAAFCTVRVDAVMGTIVWPLGDDPWLWPDWSPEELYENCDPLPGE